MNLWLIVEIFAAELFQTITLWCPLVPVICNDKLKLYRPLVNVRIYLNFVIKLKINITNAFGPG